MTKEKLIEKLKEIEGTINDADISMPSNDIGTELSDVEYYIDSSRDLVEGLIKCATYGKAGGVYNLASGVETSILELAHLINKLTNNKTPCDIIPARSWDRSGNRFGSTEKALKELNFKADTKLDVGLKKTIDWTNNNQKLIKHNILKHKNSVPYLKKYE